MSYRTSWIIHLYTSLALVLAFGHQVVNCQMFLIHPLLRVTWTRIWLATAGAVLVFSVGLPIYRSLRHQLEVVAVREEAPEVVSIVMKGRIIESLPIRGGQFMQWRLLTHELWWHAHPFSLSAMPDASYLRITVKALGDTSSTLMHLVPGTRVAMKGPYGVVTRERRAPATPVKLANRTRALAEPGALLTGGDVGITPIRALIDDLPRGTDVVVVLRARTVADLPHQAEIHALVIRHGGRTLESIGHRHQQPINVHTLLAEVPDVATRDVYRCGPQAMTDALIEELCTRRSRRARPPRVVHLLTTPMTGPFGPLWLLSSGAPCEARTRRDCRHPCWCGDCPRLPPVAGILSSHPIGVKGGLSSAEPGPPCPTEGQAHTELNGDQSSDADHASVDHPSCDQASVDPFNVDP